MSAPREWWTAAEIAEAALPGLPATPQKVTELARREAWRDRDGLARRRAGRGGGWEYHWHLLPEAARLRLAGPGAPGPVPAEVPEATPPAVDRVALHALFARQPDHVQHEARRRLVLLQEVEALRATGMRANMAVALVARRNEVGARTIWGWFALVEGVEREDRLPALAPRHHAARRPDRRTPVPERFMELLRADYMRREAPSFLSSFRRVVRIAEAERLNLIPAPHVARRRLREAVPHAAMVYAREGERGLARLFPPQLRDRTHLRAMEAVNADCHRFDVFVRWPGSDRVERPQVVAFQDLHSGKILSWRIDHAPNKVMVMAAWADLIREWGIPKHCLFDNGREFANKWMTGGAPTRFRFRVRPDEALGVLALLDVRIHWATPAHGQAKPVERTFRDLSEDISKDPRFAGAYVGRRPDAKPENYGAVAVDLETFVRVLDEGIAEHNARTGRTAPACRGRSFDATFAASYSADRVLKATPDQVRMCLMAHQEVTAAPGHGRIRFQGNMYYDHWLVAHAGEQLSARFDPEDLHDGLHLYARDGRFLGHAPVQEAVGFFDMTEAHNLSRRRRAILKAARALDRELRPLGVADVAAGLEALTPEAAARPEAKVVEGRFGDRPPRDVPPARARPAPDPDAEARREAFVADFEARRVAKQEAAQAEDARVRFTRALHLVRAAEAGAAIGETEASWLASYRNSAEWRAQLRMFEVYGEAMLAK